MNVSGNNRTLRVVALVIQILAWVILAVSVILTLVVLIGGQSIFAGIWIDGMNWIGLGFLIWGISQFVPLYAVGAGLALLANISDNTSANTAAIEQMARQAQAATLPPAAPKSTP
jgi:hypothetical protein